MNANMPFGRNAAKNMLNPLVSWCRGGIRQATGGATPEPEQLAPRSNRGNAILHADPPAATNPADPRMMPDAGQESPGRAAAPSALAGPPPGS